MKQLLIIVGLVIGITGAADTILNDAQLLRKVLSR